jgi:hypothetical protein
MARGRWSGRAQAIAAVITLGFLVLSFFGISEWTDWLGDKPPHNQGELEKEHASPIAHPLSNTERRILVEPLRASISFTNSFSGRDHQGIIALVSVRIRNISRSDIRLSWHDAERTAVFELDDGTALRGDATSEFSGFSNCGQRRADRCSYADATLLAAGENQVATMTLRTDLPLEVVGRIASANTGNLNAGLVVFPPAPAQPFSQPVSLMDFRLVNNAR